MHRQAWTTLMIGASVAFAAGLSLDLTGCSSSASDSGATSSADDALQLEGPSVLSCTDANDRTTVASFKVSTSYVVTWQLGAFKGKGPLLAADKTGGESTSDASYAFRVASGEYFEINVRGSEVYFGHGSAMVACASAASFQAPLFDALVTATNESRAAQKDFATCTFDAKDGDHAPETGTITKRPSLDGNGFVLEASVTDRSVAFLARTTSLDGQTYTGSGAETTFEGGEHESTFTSLTLGSSLEYASNAAAALPTSTCTKL